MRQKALHRLNLLLQGKNRFPLKLKRLNQYLRLLKLMQIRLVLRYQRQVKLRLPMIMKVADASKYLQELVINRRLLLSLTPKSMCTLKRSINIHNMTDIITAIGINIRFDSLMVQK